MSHSRLSNVCFLVYHNLDFLHIILQWVPCLRYTLRSQTRFLMFPPAFHRFSPIVFPICSPVRYTVTDMSQFRFYVMQQYSHRREGLPRRAGAELFCGSLEKSWVPRINLEFIINKPCLSRISFSKVSSFGKKVQFIISKSEILYRGVDVSKFAVLWVRVGAGGRN